MTELWKTKGRNPLFRFKRKGNLPFPPAHEFLCACLILLVVGPGLLFQSCNRALPEQTDEEVIEEIASDKVLTELYIDTAVTAEIRNLQILVFRNDGIRELAQIIQADNGGAVKVWTDGGEWIAVAIANSTTAVERKSVSRYDGLSQLEFMFQDDDPQAPVMTGVCGFAAGERGKKISLEPFMCRVDIASVSNAMDGDVLVENASVRLTDMNPIVNALQEDEFIAAEVIAEGRKAVLPYDVGFYTQYPGISLYCYPDTSPRGSLGSLSTGVLFECEIDGEKRSSSCSLPELPRGSSVSVDITVFSPDDIRFFCVSL